MVKSVASETKVIARHSAVYGLANVLDRVVSFVMIPVYTRFLSPADYGILELVYMTTSIIGLVVGLGIEEAVSRFYFDYEEEDKRNTAVSTAFWGYGGMALIFTLVFLPTSGLMAKYILNSAALTSYFVVALVTLGVGMVIPVGTAYLRVRRMSMAVLIFQVSKTAFSLGLNIYFVVFAGKGVFGILLATMITNLLFGVVMSVYILSRTGVRTDFKLLWQMIRFGLPLIPSNLGGYVVHASDRYFIKQYANLTLTGLYSLGYRFGALVNEFVASPFIQIWLPRRFEYFNREDSERIYARIFTYYVAFSLFVGLQISLLSRDIIRIMTTEPFWPAYKVVPIIVLSYIIFSFHYHFSVGVFMKKATKYLAYVNIANGVLNIILNFALIPRYTIWGAAYATLICFIFKAIMTFYYSNMIYRIHMEWKRVSLLFLTAFAVYIPVVNIHTGSPWLNLAVKSVLGCGFVLVLFVFRFFTTDEIARIKNIIRTRKLDFE